MKKSWFVTTGSLALAGAMAGLGAFGGMAFASTPTTVPTTPAIVQPAVPTAPATAVKPSLAETKTASTEQDNVDFQQQGDQQGNNGVAETGAGTTEQASAEETSSGPDTDTLNVQQ